MWAGKILHSQKLARVTGVDLTAKLLESKIPGLKIYNFHPIHIALNSKNLDNYNKLKLNKDIQKLEKKDIQKFINHGKGARTFLIELLDFLDSRKTYTIKQIPSLFN